MAGPRPHARQYTTRLNAFEQAAFWSLTSPFGSGPGGPLCIEYERHEPEKTLLHEVVREQLESFLARAGRNGAPRPYGRTNKLHFETTDKWQLCQLA